MPETVSLPGKWEQRLERTESDSVMDREYTTLSFVHPPTEQTVIINEVQEPNSFGGWGYLVHVPDPQYGELDLVDDLRTARDIALEFMDGHAEQSA
ncbi:MAG: hypothetical protein ABEI98_10635 [Halorhabdus sp.]